MNEVRSVRSEAVPHRREEVEITLVRKQVPCRSRGQICTVDLRHERQPFQPSLTIVNGGPVEIVGHDRQTAEVTHASLRQSWRENVPDREAGSQGALDRLAAVVADRRNLSGDVGPNARLVRIVGLLRLRLNIGQQLGNRVGGVVGVWLATPLEFAFDRFLQIPGAGEEVSECGIDQ